MLDLGCGWGPLLDFVRRRGGAGVGVTLSSAQAAACRRHGLDVHLHDARQVTRDSFGPFDAVASLGAFEHFCSPEEQRAGRQEEVYRGLFARIASLLPDNGRLYLQTMVFGPNMIPLDRIDIDAPRDSDAWYLALMGRQFPGSLPPIRPGADHPQRRAALPRSCRAPAAGSTTSRPSANGASGSRRRASERRCSSSSCSLAG